MCIRDRDIVVSSEDDEILNTAQKFSAKIHKRDLNIADDKTTLDPVIYDCYIQYRTFGFTVLKF